MRLKNLVIIIFVLLPGRIVPLSFKKMCTIKPWIQNKVPTIFKNPLLGYKQQYIQDKVNSTAQIQKNNSLSLQEKQCIKERDKKSRSAMEQLLELSPDSHKIPNLAIAATGGGYRALILTLGYLIGAQEIGLLDSVKYISSLSGSTWLLGSWIFSGQDIKDFRSQLLSFIDNKTFNLTGAAYSISLQYVKDYIFSKMLFKQPLGLVDVYGLLLQAALINKNSTLSEQLPLLKKGNYPFPLYTAISTHKENEKVYYNWYEFNPVEIRNLDYNITMPAYSFNWHFDKGVSVEQSPEVPFGFLMGIFGSAYSANAKDAFRIVQKRIELIQNQSEENYGFHKAIYPLLKLINNFEQLSVLRASATRVNNPYKNYLQDTKNSWLEKRKYLTFVDAGIDYNIPILPLLRPEREINVCLIVDSTNPFMMNQSLHTMFVDVKNKHGYHYTRVDDKTTNTLHCYKDLNNKKAPLLLYINFIPDAALFKKSKEDPELNKLIKMYNLDGFDFGASCNKGYCRTTNFTYTSQEFLQLSALAEVIMRSNKNAIKDFLNKEFFDQ